jgi:hypothetical protein
MRKTFCGITLISVLLSAMTGCVSTKPGPQAPVEQKNSVAPGAATSGKDFFFVVSVEKVRTYDVRWAGKLSAATLADLEAKGRTVRPNRNSAFVVLWDFRSDGEFRSAEMVNWTGTLPNTSSWADLEAFFQNVPRSNTHWAWNQNLLIEGVPYDYEVLKADDDASGGRAGEVVLTVKDRSGTAAYDWCGQMVGF